MKKYFYTITMIFIIFAFLSKSDTDDRYALIALAWVVVLVFNLIVLYLNKSKEK